MAGLSSPSIEASKHRAPRQACCRYYKIQRNLRTAPTLWCQVAIGQKDKPRRRESDGGVAPCRDVALEGMEAAVEAAVEALPVAAVESLLLVARAKATVEGMEGCVLVDP